MLLASPHCCVLEVLRALVGCEGQQHHPLIGVAEEWRHAVLAHVGGHGEGVDVKSLKEALGIHFGGVANVAALGVGDYHHVGIIGADVGHSVFKGLVALHALHLIEGQIGLEGYGVLRGGVDYGLVEGQQVAAKAGWHLAEVGVEAHAQE